MTIEQLWIDNRGICDMEIICGDCLGVMRGMGADSVDAIVTDPPYGLEFMGKEWDHGSPGVSFWLEAIRIAKPGCHLLAFGGTRTFHRLVCAIEDAGWEIRDCLGWIYGSGFPKSHDVSKAIDKVNGEAGRLRKFVRWMRTTGLKAAVINAAIEKSDIGSHYLRLDQPAIPTRILWAKLRPFCGDIPAWVDKLVERIEAEREIVGKHSAPAKSIYGGGDLPQDVPITAPATDAARQWQGWGTALKPAWEPIILARKPLDGTVAENVQKWGTGAINVDACRVAMESDADAAQHRYNCEGGYKRQKNWHLNDMSKGTLAGGWKKPEGEPPTVKGRWPANLIHDGSDEVVGLFPQARSSCGGGHRLAGKSIYGIPGNDGGCSQQYYDSGSAARFFYCSKASRAEREMGLGGMEVDGREFRWNKAGEWTNDTTKARNHHPCVKPLALMRYLCRLVTPPNGLILDPFAGSGTTGMAAKAEGFRFIGVEKEAEYCEIARRRIAAVVYQPDLIDSLGE